MWTNYDNARWCGVRDSAHEKLYKLLSDPVPEVRLFFLLFKDETLASYGRDFLHCYFVGIL